VGLVVIEEFKRAGIAASLRTLDWSILLERVKHFDYDAVILGWTPGGSTPPDLYQIWHSSQAVEGGSTPEIIGDGLEIAVLQINQGALGLDHVRGRDQPGFVSRLGRFHIGLGILENLGFIQADRVDRFPHFLVCLVDLEIRLVGQFG